MREHVCAARLRQHSSERAYDDDDDALADTLVQKRGVLSAHGVCFIAGSVAFSFYIRARVELQHVACVHGKYVNSQAINQLSTESPYQPVHNTLGS
jgi:hypothetical protein